MNCGVEIIRRKIRAAYTRIAAGQKPWARAWTVAKAVRLL